MIKITLLGTSGWLSQLSVRLLILAQVMISRFVSSSHVLGLVLTVQSLLGILSLLLSRCLPLSLPLPPKINNKHFFLKEVLVGYRSEEIKEQLPV